MEKDLALIEQFLDALWLEKNLAENTLSAYRRDLTMLVEWLAHRGLSLANAQSDDLQALLGERMEGGYKATSSARLLSAMRRLFQHLNREKIREDEPSRSWPPRNSRSGCRKISAKHKLRDYYSHPQLTCRWSYAIKPCLSYCMLPVCVFLNWSA